MTAVAQIVSALAWPAASLAMARLFREPLARLLGRLRVLRWEGLFEGHFAGPDDGGPPDPGPDRR